MPIAAILVVAAALFALSAGSALAGDAAARRIVGFSPDGGVFAFEQYTLVYDDDAAFAEYQFVDTERDRFLPGTPVRELVRGDDGLDENKARADAARRAAPLIGRHHIGERGLRVAGRPSMDLDEIGIYQMGPEPLATGLELPAEAGGGRLVLGERSLGTAICPGAGGTGIDGEVAVAGLMLSLERSGKPPIVLADDGSLPKRRRCALHYGIAEAWWLPAGTGGTLAVLIEYADADDYHAGPNRRFMAVTRRLED